jgi:hypothetical protein
MYVVYPVSVAKQTQRAAVTPAPKRTPEPATFNRTERVLAFMVAGVFGVSFVCVIIMIVAWLTVGQISGSGAWPLITTLPLIGFPIGMVIMFVLLGVTWTRKARENRNGTR